jgi:hypothetical protein
MRGGYAGLHGLSSLTRIDPPILCGFICRLVGVSGASWPSRLAAWPAPLASLPRNIGSGDLGKRTRSASLRWWKLRQSIEERASPKCDFMGLPSYPPSQLIDRWDQCEGYGGPKLDEKCFSNYSIFIV